MDDGVKLDATLFLPPGAAPKAGWPLVVVPHGFGLDKFNAIPSCSSLANKGYAALCFTVRGHGVSGGQSTIMSTRERTDLRGIFAFGRGLSSVDSNSVAVIGGSQAGLHGLWSIIDDLHPKAVVASLIDPQWATDMLDNGSIRTTLVDLLQSNQVVRYAPVRDTLWSMLVRGSYDSLAVAFPKNRDLDTATVQRAHIPLLWNAVWQDHYFAASQAISSVLAYQGPKAMTLATVGHESDRVPFVAEYVWRRTVNWLVEYLQGIAPPRRDRSFTYGYSALPTDSLGNFAWDLFSADSYPPGPITNDRLYLAGASRLATARQNVDADSVEIPNGLLTPGFTLVSAVRAKFGAPFQRALPREMRSFRSDPLAQSRLWLGQAEMHLFVRSDYDEFPLDAQIYEEDAAGERHFVNRIDFTAHHWIPGASGRIDVSGIAQAHEFTKGNRIVVVLTNIDVTERNADKGRPFVLPLVKKSGVTVFLDREHPSYVTFPMLEQLPAPSSFSAAGAAPPVVSGRVFRPATLSPNTSHRSFWDSHVRRIAIRPAGAGLHCTVTSDSTQAGYGGVKFAAGPFDAMRLEMAFGAPEHIRYVFVDGYGPGRERLLRWEWAVQKRTTPHEGRETFILVPNQPCGHFEPVESRSLDRLSEVHVFLQVDAGETAGFTLFQAELASNGKGRPKSASRSGP